MELDRRFAVEAFAVYRCVNCGALVVRKLTAVQNAVIRPFDLARGELGGVMGGLPAAGKAPFY